MKKKRRKLKRSLESQGATVSHPLASRPKWDSAIVGLGLIILILTGVLYANTLNAGFFFDDNRSIVYNHDIRSLDLLLPNWFRLHYRFISRLTFFLNYQIGELNTFSYHVTNVIIHSLSALTVYGIALVLIANPFVNRPVNQSGNAHQNRRHLQVAFFVAALFAVHPVQTQAVSYLAQRDASLAGMFYFLSLLFYLLSVRNRSWRLKVVSWMSFVLGLYSKMIVITLPIVILACAICFEEHQKARVWSLLKRAGPYLLIVGGMLTLYYALSGQAAVILKPERHVSHSRSEYFLTQFGVLCTYLRLMFLPYGQTLDYDYPIQSNLMGVSVLMPLMMLVLIGIFMVKLFKKNRLLCFSIAWFFITISIESSIIPLSDVINEHRLYIPMMGFCLFVGWGFYLLMGRQFQLYRILMVGILIACSLLTYRRNQLWASEPLFWQDVIAKAPAKVRPVINLANYYEDQGNCEEAIRYALKAVEMDPGVAQTYDILGLCHAKMGNRQKAVTYFNKAIAVNKEYVKAYNNLAVVYDQMNNLKSEIEILKQAIRIKPDYHAAHANLGIAYGKSGKYKEAVQSLEKAIQLNPADKKSLFNLGVVYSKLGDFNNARNQMNQLGHLDPAQRDRLKAIIARQMSHT